MCCLLTYIWNAKDGQGGRSKDSYEWTSLRGHDKRVLMNKLPEKIPSLITGFVGDNVKKLWDVCTCITMYLNDMANTNRISMALCRRLV